MQKFMQCNEEQYCSCSLGTTDVMLYFAVQKSETWMNVNYTKLRHHVTEASYLLES